MRPPTFVQSLFWPAFEHAARGAFDKRIELGNAQPFLHELAGPIMTYKAVAKGYGAAILASMACNGEEPTAVYEDTGSICLSQQDNRVRMALWVDVCLRPPCRVQKEALCRASVEGRRITITSRVEVAEPDTDDDCVDGCIPASTTCDVAAPGDGAYEVVHGIERGSVVLPLSQAMAVFGSPDACNSLGGTGASAR